MKESGLVEVHQVLFMSVVLIELIDGDCRYYGRKMLFTLMTHADFDKMLEKYVLPKDLHYVKETVNSLRQKVLHNALLRCHVCINTKQGGWLIWDPLMNWTLLVRLVLLASVSKRAKLLFWKMVPR